MHKKIPKRKSQFPSISRARPTPKMRKPFDQKLLDKVVGTINKRSSIASEFQKNILLVALKSQKMHLANKMMRTKKDKMIEEISSQLGLMQKDPVLAMMEKEAEKLVEGLIEMLKKYKKTEKYELTFSESSSGDESTSSLESDIEPTPVKVKPPSRKPKIPQHKIPRPKIVKTTAKPVQTKTSMSSISTPKFKILPKKVGTDKSKLHTLKPKYQYMGITAPKANKAQRRSQKFEQEERLSKLAEEVLKSVRYSKEKTKKAESIKDEIKSTEKAPLVTLIKEQLAEMLKKPIDTTGSDVTVKEMEKKDYLKTHDRKKSEEKLSDSDKKEQFKTFEKSDEKLLPIDKLRITPRTTTEQIGPEQKLDTVQQEEKRKKDRKVGKTKLENLLKKYFTVEETNQIVPILLQIKIDSNRVDSILKKEKKRLSESDPEILDEPTKQEMVGRVSELLGTIALSPKISGNKKKRMTSEKTSIRNVWAAFMRVAIDDEEESTALLLERKKRKNTITEIHNKLYYTTSFGEQLDKADSITKQDEPNHLIFLRRKSSCLDSDRIDFVGRAIEKNIKILEEQALKSKVPKSVLLEEQRRQSLIKASKEQQKIDSRKHSTIKETTMEEILEMRGFRGRVKNRGNEIWIHRPYFLDYFKPMNKGESRFEMAKRTYNQGRRERIGVSVPKKPTEDKKCKVNASQPLVNGCEQSWLSSSMRVLSF